MAHRHNFDEKEDNSTQQTGCLRRNLLLILTLVGVVGGVGFGYILKMVKDDWSDREAMYVNFVGELFLRTLKALILPLIVSSLVTAIAGMDLSLSGKIATRAVCFYLTTTFASVVLGIILVTTIKPGEFTNNYNPKPAPGVASKPITTVDTLMDLVRNMLPPNIVEATIFQTRTALTPPEDSNTTDLYEYDIHHENVMGMNIIGLVVVSIIVGITLSKLGDEVLVIKQMFDGVMSISMVITSWVIWLAPIGLFSLVASKIVEIDDIADTLTQLGMYFVTVIIGLLLQGFIILPALFFILTRHNPFAYIYNLSEALATAFGTGSSSASLAVTMRCIEEKNGIDKKISRFCLPIGCTINMDGTALYEAVAAIFIAQVRQVPLNFGNIVAISITATAASIGAAGIPQAGLVTMVMVLDACGLPSEDISIILAVDWLLDRCRTTINVLGDSIGAGIVHHMSQKELELMNKKEEMQSC